MLAQQLIQIKQAIAKRAVYFEALEPRKARPLRTAFDLRYLLCLTPYAQLEPSDC